MSSKPKYKQYKVNKRPKDDVSDDEDLNKNLSHKIETINALNVDNESSTICGTEVIRNTNNISKDEYILSDADEELLILIKFEHIISLKSIKIHASNNIDIDKDISPPKQVYVYKLKNLNINFDDIDTLKPDKSIKCSSKQLEKGQLIKLQSNSKMAVTFSKTQYLAIYIKSNQKDTEITSVNGIEIIGDDTSSVNTVKTVIISITEGNIHSIQQ